MPLQNLTNKVTDGVQLLYADNHQSFRKLEAGIIVFVEVASHVQSTQNRKLVIFLQYFKKV